MRLRLRNDLTHPGPVGATRDATLAFFSLTLQINAGSLALCISVPGDAASLRGEFARAVGDRPPEASCALAVERLIKSIGLVRSATCRLAVVSVCCRHRSSPIVVAAVRHGV